MRPGGRFIEMGKTDIRPAADVSGRHPGIGYRAFDLTEAGPDRIQEMLSEIMGLFRTGALELPPLTTWDVRQAIPAFRFMSQARHTGKIVLTIPLAPDPEGTVLITGGTGTLAGLVARHLAEQGARHFLLLSRHGPGAAGADALNAELTALGASVRIAACDVADRADLARALAAVPADHPLTAVVHTAGVIDDQMLTSLTADQIGAVMRPKVDAALHLHELTAQANLAEFVMFSSAAGLTGAPGQGNYAAANVFLDALCCHRRASGLPATSIAWGLWAATSGLTANLTSSDLARITGYFTPLSTELALALFDSARQSAEPVVLASAVPAGRLRALARDGSLPPLWRGLINAPVQPRLAAADPVAGLARQLTALNEAEQQEFLLRLVRSHAAITLGGSDVETVAPDRPFREIGFDSLTAVDLRNRLASATGRRFSATLIFDHPTATELASYLRTQLTDGAAAMPVPVPVLGEMPLGRWNDTLPADAAFESATDEQLFELIDGNCAGFG
jgi:NAD(P)-dependent dehydrogenase (short-subunit alcohol dehydrogenase family)/acyl carrier protein